MMYIDLLCSQIHAVRTRPIHIAFVKKQSCSIALSTIHALALQVCKKIRADSNCLTFKVGILLLALLVASTQQSWQRSLTHLETA